MTRERKFLIFNIIALLCGLWFLAVGWVWVYFANLIFALPVGILGFIFWRLGKPTEKKTFHKIIGWIYLLGLAISVGFLLYWLIFLRGA